MSLKAIFVWIIVFNTDEDDVDWVLLLTLAGWFRWFKKYQVFHWVFVLLVWSNHLWNQLTVLWGKMTQAAMKHLYLHSTVIIFREANWKKWGKCHEWQMDERRSGRVREEGRERKKTGNGGGSADQALVIVGCRTTGLDKHYLLWFSYCKLQYMKW